jgi:hypothetical protein
VSGHVDTAKEQLRRLGFAAIEGLFTDHELRAVEDILDRLVLRTDPAYEGRKRELSGEHGAGMFTLPEFSRPTVAMRGLADTGVYKKCQAMAKELLGRRAHYLFDHAIYKMPRSGGGIPWHQDQAYLGTSVQIQSLHFWIPLQETDATNGCLRFIAGSDETGLQPHTSAYTNNAHVLRTSADYREGAIDLPLRKGDASIHTNLTIHSSAPNRSDDICKAWIIHFGDKSIWHKRIMQLKDVAAAAALLLTRGAATRRIHGVGLTSGEPLRPMRARAHTAPARR